MALSSVAFIPILNDNKFLYFLNHIDLLFLRIIEAWSQDSPDLDDNSGVYGSIKLHITPVFPLLEARSFIEWLLAYNAFELR